MDRTKRTSQQYLRYTIIIVSTLITGVIISHFFMICHTQTAIKKTIALPSEPTHKIVTPTPLQTQTLTVRKGDILASLFHRAGLPSTEWITILQIPRVTFYLDHLQPGNTMEITTNDAHQITRLLYSLNLSQSLQIQQKNNHYLADIIQKPVTKTIQFKSSVIHNSLPQAEKAAGLPLDLQHQLNTMFANGNISNEIRPGDRLEVLYHEYFVNDEKDHPGHIIAAEITNGKQHYRVVRYTAPDDKTGVYKANGDGTMPEFLKIPLHYVRIGSRFNYHRYDPILHRVQPHLGVDFDAPMGTPVRAIGNGVITFCSQMRGYGNVLIVRYNKTYKSLYAHLEKFASVIKPHEYVKKGEIIGYVGMTGWTTGPHLHFAIYKNGVAVNPLTVHFPHESPLPKQYRHAFFNKEDHWFHEMHLFEKAKLAEK